QQAFGIFGQIHRRTSVPAVRAHWEPWVLRATVVHAPEQLPPVSLHSDRLNAFSTFPSVILKERRSRNHGLSLKSTPVHLFSVILSYADEEGSLEVHVILDLSCGASI